MQRPKHSRFVVVMLPLLCLLTACTPLERARNELDRWSFSLSGGTVFSEPFQVTTKQLHLDTGSLFGQDLVLEGAIKSMGEQHTHLVLGDAEGRMLIVLTELENAYQALEAKGPQHVRVLGRLERGKKGLPYIRALAIRTIDAPELAEEKGQPSDQAHGKVPPKSPSLLQ